jgi:histidinol-phosphatase
MDFSLRTIRAAGDIAMKHFGFTAVEFKKDGTELTAADTAAETFLRAEVAANFPDHAILGEEGGATERPSRYRWVIDPIDGTRSFASGVPLFGMLLSLEEDGVPVVGCCHFPATGETLIAATGAGCWLGDRRVSVSACDRLADARVVTSGLEYWRDWATPEGRAGFDRLVSGCRIARTWGDCFGHALVATGRAEIFADPACGKRWDYSAIIPIISEAGGKLSTLGNLPIRDRSTGLTTNGLLHSTAVACWGQGREDLELQTPAFRSRGSP